MGNCYNFLLGLLLVPCLVSCSAMAATNISTDKSALLAFKARITSDPYLILASNWSTATSVCDWVGVTCGSRHRRVIALNISHMALTGTIPPHFGNLSFLSSLDMEKNYFHSHLPEEMSHLRRLRYIQLGYNSFTGGIPSWFGLLSNTQYLSLRNNSFTGFLPPSLFNLSKLEILSIHFNSIEGNIPAETSKLSNLKELGLQFNQLIGSIPFTIFNISTLEYISFTGNYFSGILPVNICHHLLNLKGLYLSANKLNGHIPSNLSQCSALKILSLSVNNFGGHIPREIGNLKLLEELYLGKNNLNGVIPKEMGALHNLRILAIKNANIMGPIPKEIGNLTNLEVIDLSHNYLSGFIPQEFSNLNKLERIFMNFNSLSGTIPDGIFNISTVQFISFTSNNFTGNLPSQLCYRWPNLEVFVLGKNSLSGAIPDSISNCSKLTVLDLDGNKFSGFIPNSLGDLRFLENLLLSENNLRSEFSSPELSLFTLLTNCRSLKRIVFSENPLNGILPISIGNLSSSMEEILLHGCEIKGGIPESIGNLSNLITLSLSSNLFTGSIPFRSSGLLKLQGLYLSNNNIGGVLSASLCHLQSANTIDISQNQISGPILECLDNITSLRYLYLSFNRLSSTVPESLWNLNDLLELNLTTNQLTGGLSPQIGKLKALISIDLSKNHLSGNIPSTIGGLRSLIKAYLANNNLEGSIPASISGLLGIESLDLSHNNLSGSIPKSMELLKSLKDFNVSFNDLGGEIPLGGPFKSFTSESFMNNKALCGAPKFNVPECKAFSASKRKTIKHLKLLFILLGVGITSSMTLVFVCFRYRKKAKVPSETELALSITQKRISYFELLHATNGYDESNLLGKGSFGSVYKGTLNNGMIVAVKVFHLQQELFKSFNIECEVLKILRHRNLTKVITSCSTPDFKALVLEFISNGSLEKWLYSHNCFLGIMQRLNVMIDIACALQYLHNGSSTPVVHCDLKPSNVLLDQEFVAHVTDFGMAKLLGHEESVVYTKSLATLGYTAPEYGLEGQVSTRCDVYSFGIVLLEAFTRTKPNDEMFNGDLSLKRWVAESIPNRLVEVIDSNLLRSCEENTTEVLECISSIMEVALNCSSDNPRERKNMEDVLAALNKIKHRHLSYLQISKH